jgi:hypothetical protein
MGPLGVRPIADDGGLLLTPAGLALIFGTRMVRVLTTARGNQGIVALTYNPFTLKEM